jgi:hypothetical protein
MSKILDGIVYWCYAKQVKRAAISRNCWAHLLVRGYRILETVLILFPSVINNLQMFGQKLLRVKCVGMYNDTVTLHYKDRC